MYKMLQTEQSMKILDVGSGDRPKEEANILIDVNPTIKNKFKDKEVIIYDLNKGFPITAFKEYSIDKIYCSNLYEHIECCHQCFTNDIYKILKYKGHFILELPNGYFITHRLRYLFGWYYHDNVKAHKQHFHKKEILGFLHRAGFKMTVEKNLMFFILPSLFLPKIKIVAQKAE